MIKIGDTLYRFDENRRRYRMDEGGRSVGGPIYSEHFERGTVIGETKLSWLCCIMHGEHKVNKKTLREASPGYGAYRWYTEAQKLEDAWVKENRHAIVERVSRCENVEVLRAILATLESAP